MELLTDKKKSTFFTNDESRPQKNVIESGRNNSHPGGLSNNTVVGETRTNACSGFGVRSVRLFIRYTVLLSVVPHGKRHRISFFGPNSDRSLSQTARSQYFCGSVGADE